MDTTKEFYWLNDKSRKFLKRGYLSEGVEAEDRIRQCADFAEKDLKIKGFSDKFFSYMAKGWYSLSSPIWANYGLSRGLPISCNGSYIPDTMDGILSKQCEVGMMTKHGAGTSAFFGDLRGRGAGISSGGSSSGPVHFMQLFNSTTNVVAQSNVRRGSFAAYLSVDHPDIKEFLQIKEEGNEIQDISIGVCIPDEWMNDMLYGKDKQERNKKRDIWALIINKRFESGYPYIFFTDTINNAAPQVYKDKGMKIHASNLCVAGGQRVPSNRGILRAEDLYEMGEHLVLFDNDKYVNSLPMKLVERGADTYKITLDNGMSHTITSYHKVCVFNKRIQKKGKKQLTLTKDVECLDLKIGDLVAVQTNKGIFGKRNMQQEAYLLGLYQADGTQNKDKIHLCLWEKDFDLEKEIQECHDFICDKYQTQISSSNNREYPKARFGEANTGQSEVRKRVLVSNALKKALNFEKGYIPFWIWESNESTQWQYIRGLFYADGTVYKSSSKGEPIQLSLASINKEFLEEVQIILANLGIQTSIRILRLEGETLLPDGHGGSKLYKTKDCWRLIVGNKNDALIFNQKTQFLTRKGIALKNRIYRNNTKKFYPISKIEYAGKEDVYCCKVDSEKHHWVCNGVITHNCSEITLSSERDESFVCDLSSMNLLHYEEWKDTDAIEVLSYFLDAVMTDYIRKVEKIPFMSAAHRFAKNQRALGIGVLGWHSFLQSKMIPFESMEAKILNNQIFKLIKEKTNKATREMAEKYGEPELLKGYGIRNVTMMAIAPTTSSSFILGQVSPSIEPLNSNYFIKGLAKGKFTYKNPYLKRLLGKHNKDSKEVWTSILQRGGSVQHLDFLSTEEKNVFKTFGEISQKEIVIQAAARQKDIDQSQSLNVMVDFNVDAKDSSELLIFGWKNKIKTFYYQRGTNPAQQLSRDILNCASCEG